MIHFSKVIASILIYLYILATRSYVALKIKNFSDTAITSLEKTDLFNFTFVRLD